MAEERSFRLRGCL